MLYPLVMALETERKFLLKNDEWRGIVPGILYCQGYLSSHADRTVRVRTAGEGAFLTIKGRNVGGSAAEYEYPIPLADAREMLENLAERPLIEKIRYPVPYRGMVWEIDEFLGENQGLVLAEVELDSINQSFEQPAWIGKEVTGDPRYFNASLVRNPFKNW